MASKDGYIYVLSNKVFIKNLFKIGITQIDPKKRAEELSRNTSAPDKFSVEYFIKVENISLAEKRVHLILNKFRFCKNKEFYLVDLNIVKRCIDSISGCKDITNCLNSQLYVDNDIICVKYSIKQSLNDMKLLRILFCCSTFNTLLDHITKFSNDGFLIQGFLSSKVLSQYLTINTNSALKIMKTFMDRHKNTYCYINNKKIKVFKELIYLRGELGWTFTKEYRNFFISINT